MFTLAQMQAPQLPDLPTGPSLDRVRGPVEIPLFETWQIVGISAGGVVLTALAIWAIAAMIRKQRNAPSPVEPRTAALQTIEVAAQHSGDDDSRFAQITAGALHRYYEDGLGIRTQGQTTQELTQRLEAAPLELVEAHAALKGFLKECDQIKFARKQLSPTEREQLSKTAVQIIELCSQRKETTSR